MSASVCLNVMLTKKHVGDLNWNFQYTKSPMWRNFNPLHKYLQTCYTLLSFPFFKRCHKLFDIRYSQPHAIKLMYKRFQCWNPKFCEMPFNFDTKCLFFMKKYLFKYSSQCSIIRNNYQSVIFFIPLWRWWGWSKASC